MKPKSDAVGNAMDAAKSAAVKNAANIKSVKVKVKFDNKIGAMKKKAEQYGAKC